MRIQSLLLVLVAGAAFTLAGCGGSGYVPPKTNSPQGSGTGGGGVKKKKAPKKGKSYLREYKSALSDAFKSQKAYYAAKDKDKEIQDEAYVKWAQDMFAALSYKKMHALNGHSADKLPRVTELNQMKGGDFKYALGPSDDPRVEKAIKEYEAAGEE